MNHHLRLLLFAGALLLLLLTLARMYVAWRDRSYLTQTCGTWTALAVDLKDGVFYRPLYGNLGYGGTRYFPLHFVLHAALLKLGVGPIESGFVLAVVAILALLFGTYRILRELRIDPAMAACVSVFVLAPETTQLGILSIRADVLAAALNILGVAVCMRPSLQLRHWLGASLLFTLAFATKETTLFGVGAVSLSFLLSGRVKKGLQILLATGLGCACVVGAMVLATEGRVITILRACAAGGNYSLPVGLLHVVIVPARTDAVVFVFMILGFAAFYALPRGRHVSIPALLFLLTGVATFIILGSAFSSINHLIDLHVAALIILAAWLFDEEAAEKSFGIAALGCAVLLALFPQFWNLRHQDNVPNGASPPPPVADSSGFREMLRALGKQGKPILAENPLLPILAGQSPYFLDFYVFHVLSEKDPWFAEPVIEATRQRRFGAIIVWHKVEAAAPTLWGWPIGELKEIEQNYQLVREFPNTFIYLPRERPDGVKSLLPTTGRHERQTESAH
jgi:hypothetical protein